MRKSIKKITCILLSSVMLLSGAAFVSCNEQAPNTEPEKSESIESTSETTLPKPENDQPTTAQTTSKQPSNDQPESEKHVLDGKRVIFIGNSHTYYGKTVIDKSGTTQEARSKDKGMFYQLCKLNGADVTVTNWTFASHNLIHTFGECTKCSGIKDHAAYLINRKYDYVVIQEGSSSGTPESFLSICGTVINFFKEANPDVKFILTISTRVVDGNYKWLSAVEELQNKHGVIISDLGHMVWDIVNGKTAVPGSQMTYNKNSFIISKSSSDGYHPNLLTGYLTALFAYCAITGESAVGQPYLFATDSDINSAFSVSSFIKSYYTYNTSTNFQTILKSKSEMEGLQKLVDEYLKASN